MLEDFRVIKKMEESGSVRLVSNGAGLWALSIHNKPEYVFNSSLTASLWLAYWVTRRDDEIN